MKPVTTISPLAEKVSVTLTNFVRWLGSYGEVSWDHQSFFAGPLGSRAKSLYYKNKLLGTAAVAPMIFGEAFFPLTRKGFHHPIRLPIADAHYAMGFAILYEATGNHSHLEKAVHFLDVLKKTRCRVFENFCWGYLDRTVVEYAQQLNSHFKVRRGERKWLHRRVCEKFLPRQILKRKKRGFAVNVVDAWLQSSAKGKFTDVLLDNSSLMFQLLKLEPVKKLLEDHQSRRQDNHKLLFSLVMFEQWLRGVRSQS